LLTTDRKFVIDNYVACCHEFIVLLLLDYPGFCFAFFKPRQSSVI
jgi:hypothetical protein